MQRVCKEKTNGKKKNQTNKLRVRSIDLIPPKKSNGTF